MQGSLVIAVGPSILAVDTSSGTESCIISDAGRKLLTFDVCPDANLIVIGGEAESTSVRTDGRHVMAAADRNATRRGGSQLATTGRRGAELCKPGSSARARLDVWHLSCE